MEFKVGEIIYHDVLGEGEVVKITERKGDVISDLPIVEVKFKNSTHEMVREEKSAAGYRIFVTYETPYYEFTTKTLSSHLLPNDILE